MRIRIELFIVALMITGFSIVYRYGQERKARVERNAWLETRIGRGFNVGGEGWDDVDEQSIDAPDIPVGGGATGASTFTNKVFGGVFYYDTNIFTNIFNPSINKGRWIKELDDSWHISNFRISTNFTGTIQVGTNFWRVEKLPHVTFDAKGKMLPWGESVDLRRVQ